MAPLFEQAILLLSAPTGNLVYALILGFCVFTSLIAYLYAAGNQVTPTSKRMQLGLVLLFAIQIMLGVTMMLGWLGVIDEHEFLPPIDCALALLSLILIIWLWAFPDPHPGADWIAILIGVMVLVFGLGSLFLWNFLGTHGNYNATIFATAAYLLGSGLLIAGVILLAVRRPPYWSFGILMVVILLLGYLVQIFFGDVEADYGWYVHLGQVLAYIILLALPQRLVDIRQAIEIPSEVKTASPTSQPVTPELIQSLTTLMTEASPQGYYQEITRLVAESMQADYCLLMLPAKGGEQIIVPVGYSRLEHKNIEGITVDGKRIPTIAEAVRSGKTIRFSDRNEPELKALVDAFSLVQATQLLTVPFNPKGTNAILGLAVLSGPVGRRWDNGDSDRLISLAQEFLSVAGQYSKGGGSQAEQAEMRQKIQKAEAYADQVRLEYAQLKAKYDSVSAGGTGSAPMAVEMAVLVQNQKNLQDTISELEKRNRELETSQETGRPSMEEVEQLRQELRSALVDLARIPSTLSKSDQKMLEMQLSAVKHLDDLQPVELINSIAQEFRQPLSSIIGYTDLLLGESVGLLGAAQRKFVERVKASAERLGILLNEMVQVISIDGGRVDQSQGSVDLRSVVDEALSEIAAQINEKNINIQIELPDNPPGILVNKDALMQILENLIENACLVTPNNGQIKLLARVELQENVVGYMHISVMDQGGGIDKSDISRVFMRRYKMENPHIRGIGDVGVGLSIVKSLVELNKGRVWVESSEGTGSTFSVLLPLAENQPGPQNPSAFPG